ncbi:MAG: primosomal protein N' [Calditrichaeota bacterium]|nr:primosomal protein N' [Calditrichota bacterium]MCB9366300.1 primosomal protein N' [Calditrichota bacterium]
MKASSAQVVLPGIEGEFSYLVPRELDSSAVRGTRVLVPFRSRRVTGFIVETHAQAVPEATRAIEKVLDDIPAYDEEMLRFTKWIADYYLCPWGDALRAALPGGLDTEDQFRFALTPAYRAQLDFGDLTYSPELAELLEALEESPLSALQIQKRFGIDPDGQEIKLLKQQKLIEYLPFLRGPRTSERVEKIIALSKQGLEGIEDDSLWTQIPTRSGQRIVRELADAEGQSQPRHVLLRGASKQRRLALAELLDKGVLVERVERVSRWKPDQLPVLPGELDAPLTRHQSEVVQALTKAVESADYRGFLLFGVTGSGKTRVYIEAIRKVLAQGKTALVLVPEISLTPMLWGRFRSAFGDAVAIQHSAQPSAVRYDLWSGIARGDFPVVIGARSAIFTPLRNIGVIIVDEEHDASYKQTEGVPRYSARDAALYRARLLDAVVILGSATPSLESISAAVQGKLTKLSLPERATGARLPEVLLVPPVQDAVPEEAYKNEDEPKSQDRVLTDETLEEIRRAISRGKQAIVLQNRRGFAPFLICKFCGKLFECPNCSVSLTYHRPGKILLCHYCHHRDDAPTTCPACGADELSMCGSGTQRIAEELAELVPEVRVARMDSDAMSRLGAHEKLMSEFGSRKFDVLVGTQMVAKGLDFPEVELAVVADADTELFYPDFRASERGASLLTQLAGRSGRASSQGKVLLQTRAADHPAIRTAISGDWFAFAEQETPHREASGFPPFYKLILIRAIGPDESDLARAMLFCKRQLEKTPQIGLLGPSPCAVVKVKNRFRYQILARISRTTDPSGKLIRAAVRQFMDDIRNSKDFARVQWEVDVDPASTA